jgi:hypothetical protein
LLNELHLAKTSDLTPRKQKLYNRIPSRESALCKLRKKYTARKLKYLCDVDSDPLMQDISNSLNVEAVRLLVQSLGALNTSLREGGGILKTKFWLCLSSSIAQNTVSFPDTILSSIRTNLAISPQDCSL